jgi:hypothetical protein
MSVLVTVGDRIGSPAENYTTFKPGEHRVRVLGGLLDQLLAWGTALATQRPGAVVNA